MTSNIPPAVPYHDWTVHIGDGWYGLTQVEKIAHPQECFIWFGHPVATVPISAPVFVSVLFVALFISAAVVVWFIRRRTPPNTALEPTPTAP
jgi:hypothetical protein